jgi:hypothetical protein
MLLTVNQFPQNRSLLESTTPPKDGLTLLTERARINDCIRSCLGAAPCSEECYDPCFLLPVLSFSLNSQLGKHRFDNTMGAVDARRFVELRCLSLAYVSIFHVVAFLIIWCLYRIMAMCSFQQDMRAIGFHIVGKFQEIVQNLGGFEPGVLVALTVLRNSCSSRKPYPKVNNLTAAWFADAVCIICNFFFRVVGIQRKVQPTAHAMSG